MIERGRAQQLRACDKCGAQRKLSDGRMISGRWICNWHDRYIAPEKLERMPFRTFKARPIPNAKPFAARDTHERQEMELFDYLASYYRFETVDWTASTGITTSSTIRGAAWTAVYLYELILENERPVITVNRAKALLKTIADYLMAQMKAGPEISGTVSSAVEWGAYDRGSLTYAPHDSAIAGIALLRAYQVHGDTRYATGARACAWFVRGAQCGHILVNRPSSTDSAGASVVYWGAYTSSIVTSGGVSYWSHTYTPQTIRSAEFLTIYQSILGDETIGSPMVTATFNASREIKVSRSISDCRAFWERAIPDVLAGTSIQGFTTTTPRDGFDSYPSDKGPPFSAGQGSWFFQNAYLTGTLITSLSWADGLRAYYAMDGASAFVTGIFDWLMSFTSDSSFELPDTPTNRMSGYSDTVKWAGLKGEYAPTFALSTLLRVRETTTLATAARNGSSVYDLAAMGALAALYSSRQSAAFASMKAALGDPRPRSRGGLFDGYYIWLALLGKCGLSLQPYSDTSLNRTSTVYQAAQAGLIYRQAPKDFTGRGH